jgi:hypothetical protein
MEAMGIGIIGSLFLSCAGGKTLKGKAGFSGCKVTPTTKLWYYALNTSLSDCNAKL